MRIKILTNTKGKRTPWPWKHKCYYIGISFRFWIFLWDFFKVQFWFVEFVIVSVCLFTFTQRRRMLSDSNAIAWRQQRCSWCGSPRPPRPTAPARGPPGFTMMFLAGRLYWYGLDFRSVWRNIFGVNITFFVQISPQFPLMFWWGWIPISSNANAQLLLRIAHVSNLDGTAQFCSRAEKKSISKKK